MARQRYEDGLVNATLADNRCVTSRVSADYCQSRSSGSLVPSLTNLLLLMCVQGSDLAGQTVPGPVSASRPVGLCGAGQSHRAPEGPGGLDPLSAGGPTLPGPPQRHHDAGWSLPGPKSSEVTDLSGTLFGTLSSDWLMCFQAPINFSNSEFYGFSEFFYCTEDVLRLGGQYNSQRFSKAAAVFTPAPPCLA